MKLDYSKITDIALGGADEKDYPDFGDAYICDAKYDGEWMTDEMLEILNDDSDFVYKQVMKRFF